ncbi:hypothetical protein GCM10022419_040980 [Nonomuraea rosea]|uniref:Uncharacterized protein n=1 Tax=Nonomuraea rosea TaxID=638574 RepID=A0ABP6WT89_9ACTN
MAADGEGAGEEVAEPEGGEEAVARVSPALPHPAATSPSTTSNGTANDLMRSHPSSVTAQFTTC